MTLSRWLPLLAAGLLAAGSARAEIKADAIRIGVLTDMSSLFSDVTGAGSVVMAQMAIDDFVAAEKPAFKVRIVSADMQLKPDVAASIARSWFDQDGVDMVTDMPMSAATLAVMKLAEEKNRFVMATGAASTRRRSSASALNAVQWVYDSYSQSAATAAAITRGGADSWFLVKMDTIGGKGLADDMTTGLTAEGGKVVGAVAHPQGVSDFSSYVAQAQASPAKAIGLANSTVDTSSFIRQAQEYGLTGKKTVVASILHAIDVHGIGLEAAQGITVTDAFYWDRTPETRALSKRFFDKRSKMPTFAQAGVYSAVYQYLKAVKLAGTDEAKAVVRQLKTMTINDPVFQNGKVRPDGKMVHDMYLLQVKAPSESKYPWDYMKIKTVIPADQAFEPLSKSKCKYVNKQG